VRATARLAKFFAHESCGQCTPCREGTHWMELVLTRLERGTGSGEDAALLRRMCRNMSGTALCALADAAVGPVRSLVETFGDEVDEHVRRGACPLPPRRFFSDGPGGARA
jgi:NADH-quinone oxidoreductase subunit F